MTTTGTIIMAMSGGRIITRGGRVIRGMTGITMATASSADLRIVASPAGKRPGSMAPPVFTAEDFMAEADSMEAEDPAAVAAVAGDSNL